MLAETKPQQKGCRRWRTSFDRAYWATDNRILDNGNIHEQVMAAKKRDEKAAERAYSVTLSLALYWSITRTSKSYTAELRNNKTNWKEFYWVKYSDTCFRIY